MLKRIKTIIISQKYYAILSLFFFFYLISFILNKFSNNILVEIAQFIGGIFFMIFGTGIAIAVILQRLLKRNFDVWEFISLALISSIIVPAIILEVEFILKKRVYDWYPIANSVAIWAIAGAILLLNKISIPKTYFSLKLYIKHPFLITFIFGLIFATIQVLLYPTLPDLDPYKWLFKYTYQFSNQLLDYIERPLFGASIFIGTRFTGVSILTFLKYILPLLFLVVLFPAWMVARLFQDQKKQWIWLLFIFTSPTIMLYAQTAMPQVFLIIISYFILFFMLYSDKKKDDFFFYCGGIIAFISFFFHPAGIIIFIAWSAITIVTKHSLAFSYKKTIFWIILLSISSFRYFRNIYDFVSSWTSIVYSQIFSPNNLNLLYPAHYLNVDLKSMGWNSLSGVIKFYAFHAGPLPIAVIFIFLAMIIFSSKFRILLVKNTLSKPAILTVVSIFALFFTIAEIFPRFPNIALLPDRAWIFAGIFSFSLLFLMLNSVGRISSWILFFFIILFFTSNFGALYVNYLKRYLTTPAQIKSAEWIKKNLPENRIFISYGHKVLLPVYSDTYLVNISPDLYCSNNLKPIKNILNDMDMDENERRSLINQNYKEFFEDSAKIIKSVQLEDTIENDNLNRKLNNIDTIVNAITKKSEKLKKIINDEVVITVVPPLSAKINLNNPIPVKSVYGQGKISSSNFNDKSLYIYYARQDSRNPFYSRPYEMNAWGIKSCPEGNLLFDLYPNDFKRIYYTKNEEVIIWKVLK